MLTIPLSIYPEVAELDLMALLLSKDALFCLRNLQLTSIGARHLCQHAYLFAVTLEPRASGIPGTQTLLQSEQSSNSEERGERALSPKPGRLLAYLLFSVR